MRFDYDVFISYCSDDRKRVHPLAEQMRAAGLRIWFDEWVIPPAGDIFAAIEQGLQQSRTLLACMSPAYFRSQWTGLERNTAMFRDPMNNQRRFVPLLLADCDIPDTVRRLKFIDYRTPNEDAIKQLIDACREQEAEPKAVPDLDRIESLAFSLGHTAPIRSVAFTPDGTRAVSGSSDQTVRVWDLSSGQCLATLEGHSNWVRSVAVSPDGTRAVSGSDDQTVRVWDLSSGQCLATLEGHSDRVWSVAVSPDGTRAVSGSSDQTVRVWDLSSGQCLATLEGHSNWVRSVAVSPDGTRAVSGSDDQTVRVWDLSSGQCLATLEGHSNWVRSVAVSPDGTRAVSGSSDQTVRVWDLSSGQCLATLEGHSARVWSVAVSPDGTRAVSGSSDQTVRVWDLSSGQCLATLEGHSDSVWSVAVSPDGTRAVSGSSDQTVRVWDLSSGQCLATLEGHSDSVLSVAVSPDGTRAVSGSSDQTVRVWDLSSGQCLATLEGHSNWVRSVAVSPDGTRAVSGSDDQTVRVWDLSSGQCLATLEGHSDRVWSVAVSPDGTRAVSGSSDQTVRVWDLSSGQCLATLEGHSNWVRSVAVSPDGTRAVSGSDDQTVRVWDLSSGQCLATLEGHSDSVWSVAVSPDGTRAVSGSSDQTVRVWDLSSGQCLATLEGHSARVWSVAVSPDGTRAVSGSDDQTVRVWDLSSGQCLATLEGHSDSVLSVAVSPDGMTVYSGAVNGVLRIWSEQVVASAEASEDVSRRYTNAKVVLVGDSGVGKSGLAHRLIEDKFVETHSTHGMQVWRIDLPIKKDDGLEREALLWDLAGQKDYRLIHQLFLDETALALVLIDPQKDDPFAAAADWCKILCNSVERTCARLLVPARVDVGGINVGQAKIDRFVAENGFAGCLETSAARGDNCSDRQAGGPSRLKKLIAETVPWGELPFTSTPAALADLKNAILDMTELDEVRLLRFDELFQRLQARTTASQPPEPVAELAQSFGDPVVGRSPDRPTAPTEGLQQAVDGSGDPPITAPKVLATSATPLKPQLVRDAVSLLSNHGLVMPLKFGDLVLMRPDLLNGYGASVINAARANKDEIGSVREEDVFAQSSRHTPCAAATETVPAADIRSEPDTTLIDFSQVNRLEPADEQLLLRAMVQTFLEKSLCLREEVDGHPHLVFPSQYRRERTFPADPEIFVSYTFSGELQSIYTTLVVRLWYSREFENKELWKDAAEFRTRDGGLAGLIMNRLGDGMATLGAFFDEDVQEEQRAVFLEFIHRHLKKYAGDLQRDRRYECPNCGEPVQNVKAVRVRLERRDTHIPCVFCDASVPLIDSIEKKLASDPVARKVLEMDETAGIELSNQALEQILIGHMMTICGNANQIFRPVTMADYGIDGEIEFRDNEGKPSGRKIYVQLKCGGSNLRHRQRDEAEVFDAKEQHLTYWTSQPVDVYLVIRDAEKTIRWMNVTRYLNDRENKASRQIVFSGEEVTTEQLWIVRDRYSS